MSKQKPNRPPMSIMPTALVGGGLAAHSQSPYEAAQEDPLAKKALEDWTKEPAERVAGSIGAEVPPAQPEAVVEAPVAAAPAPAPAAEPTADATDDDDDLAPAPAVRKAKPWNDKDKELRNKNGARSPQHFRIDTEIYAKAWWLKGSTPGMTWESMIDEALGKYVNKKLRDMGYTP